MDGEERIEVNPEILGGKPVVKGTRIAVEFVIENYPHLTGDDIRACLHCAHERLTAERVYPLTG